MNTLEQIVGLHTPQLYSQTQQILNDTSCLISSSLNNDNNHHTSLQLLFIKAMIAALTSGLGGIPLYLLGTIPTHVMGFCIIFAAGLMSGCSVVLFMEALQFTNIIYAILYTILGAISIHIISYFVEEHDENISFAGLKGHNASKSLLIILSMSLHSLGEGISVGVSAQSEHENIGLLVIISLAIHNIPEGIATSLLLISRGMNIKQASLFAILSNIPQPLMAIPAFIFMDYFQSLLPIGFCFASGAMTYIVCTELIPESKEKLSRSLLLSTFFTSLGIILAIAVCAK